MVWEDRMLRGRGRGRRDVTNLRKAQPWNGRTEDSVLAAKMDSRSPPGFKAGRTRNPRMHRLGKFGNGKRWSEDQAAAEAPERGRLRSWQNPADYAWRTDMQTVTKLTVESVSEVFPVVSEARISTIR